MLPYIAVWDRMRQKLGRTLHRNIESGTPLVDLQRMHSTWTECIWVYIETLSPAVGAEYVSGRKKSPLPVRLGIAENFLGS